MQENLLIKTEQLVDSYQRHFEYLRLSITEKCNFKCQYCLPNGYQKSSSDSFLSLSEIELILQAFVQLGVKKVRLTGGEPTLRRDFNEILSLVRSFPEIKEIALTTNGSRLLDNIETWQQLGLTHLNVSIDSFSANSFHLITGENSYHKIMAGVEKALTLPNLKIKINTVLMKGLNDHLNDYLTIIHDKKIDIRFIELMETGELTDLFNQYHISGSIITEQLIEQGWTLDDKIRRSGPANMYSHPNYLGRIGVIMPYSHGFCDGCNRLRISSTGKLHYCLFGESAVDLRALIQTHHQLPELKSAILESLKKKPKTHALHLHNAGLTKNLSMIGG